MKWILSLLAVLLGAASLHAAQIEALAVNQQSGKYEIALIFSVDAPVDRVRRMLTDYAHLPKLNPSILKSEVLPAPRTAVTRVRSLMRGCLLFLCKDIACTQDMRQRNSGDLEAVIVPRLSDMKSGHANWRIEPRDDSTRVNLTALMEPDFWVPPLIGPFLIKNWLHGQLIETAENLKRLAGANP